MACCRPGTLHGSPAAGEETVGAERLLPYVPDSVHPTGLGGRLCISSPPAPEAMGPSQAAALEARNCVCLLVGLARRAPAKSLIKHMY